MGILIDKVVVSVEFQHKSQSLVSAEVEIDVPRNQEIKTRHLIDACQRAVAHAVDELNDRLISAQVQQESKLNNNVDNGDNL